MLESHETSSRATPTFEQFQARATNACTPGQKSAYAPVWRRACERLATGNDATLDCLLMRLHTETACRRGGTLGLLEQDLDPDWALIRLVEKRDTVRPSDQPLLRYRNGNPLTTRRYDHLWKRLGERLPWVASQGISTHWLRHTTLTWIERQFGYGVARAYGGHPPRRPRPRDHHLHPRHPA